MSEIIEDDYREFIADLKRRVAQAQATAARVVNRELIMLYWDIGGAIAMKQRIANWGDAVVEQIALDLKAAFPNMSGFSPRNVWYMRRFYRHYSSPEYLEHAVPEFASPQLLSILPQAVAELGVRVKSKQNEDIPGEPSPLEVFLRRLNDHQLSPDDVPSIGIILCAEKSDIEVEYALKSKTNPIGVAQYELQTKLPAELVGKLPTAEQLASVVRRTLPSLKLN